MLPLEVATETNQNDRLRSSQLYPGSVARSVCVLMQSPETRDSKFHFLTISFLYSDVQQKKISLFIQINLFLVPIHDLLLGGRLQMHHTKLVFFIGGAPTSVAETKLYKSLKVSLILNFCLMFTTLFTFQQINLVVDSWSDRYDPLSRWCLHRSTTRHHV